MKKAIRMTDNETGALLYKIEAVASSLSVRGRWLADDVYRLTRMPDWKTKAEGELALAETELALALDIVKRARARFPKQQLIAAE